jgi:tryptophanyl-tRNA synthetase
MRYGDFKKFVAERVVARLEPIQRKYREVTADPAYLDRVLRQGRDRVTPMAAQTLDAAKRAMGLYTVD